MEYLSIQITTSVNQGNWKPFAIRNQDCKILIFYLLMTFSFLPKRTFLLSPPLSQMISIELARWKLTLTNINFGFPLAFQKIGKTSHILQINNTTSLGTYLGFLLKPNYSPSDFIYIIHELRKKLQGWKMHLLSFAGRSQLISATLNQISNYQIRVFSLPQKNSFPN